MLQYKSKADDSDSLDKKDLKIILGVKILKCCLPENIYAYIHSL